jgi:hypothetical protein
LYLRIFAKKRDFGKIIIPLINSVIEFDCLLISINSFANCKGLSKMVLIRKRKIDQLKNDKSITFALNLFASLFIIFPFPVLGIIIISLPNSISEFISLAAQISDLPKGK